MPHHGHSAWTDEQGNHNHGQDGHTHTQPPHSHTGNLCYPYNGGGSVNPVGSASGYGTWYSSSAGGESTGGAQPTIHYAGKHSHNVGIGGTGDGAAFAIMPQYYTVNIWKRLS
ncbi:MAG: hypothetical protein ACRCTZ_03895 [Sarcina sp.]